MWTSCFSTNNELYILQFTYLTVQYHHYHCSLLQVVLPPNWIAHFCNAPLVVLYICFQLHIQITQTKGYLLIYVWTYTSIREDTEMIPSRLGICWLLTSELLTDELFIVPFPLEVLFLLILLGGTFVVIFLRPHHLALNLCGHSENSSKRI